MMKKLMMGVVLVAACAAVAPLRAEMDAAGNKDAAAEPDARAKIDELDKKMEAMQQEKQQLERKAQEQEHRRQLHEELTEIQRQGIERQQNIDKEADEIAKAEATDSEAVKKQRQGRLDFLKEQHEVIEDARAVKSIDDLQKVRNLRDRLEEMNAEWDLVRGPQLAAGRRLEELEKRANSEEGSPAQKELLVKIKALVDDDAATRRTELNALKARRANERMFDALADRFWKANRAD